MLTGAGAARMGPAFGTGTGEPAAAMGGGGLGGGCGCRWFLWEDPSRAGTRDEGSSFWSCSDVHPGKGENEKERFEMLMI